MTVLGRGVTDVLFRSEARVRWSGFVTCPVCVLRMPREENAMIARFSYLGRHKDVFYVDNVTLKCPRCKLLLTFGVPIGKEEYETEITERKKLGLGRSVRAEMNDDADRMRERLTRLGYLPGEIE